jgi:purine-binding chemotaxis protein CheW
MRSHEILDPDAETTSAENPLVESVFFVVRLGSLAYALPPGVVEVVAPEQRPVPVPTAPSHVRGVVYVRGRIAVVVDLATLLGLDDAAAGDPAARRLVLVGVSGVGFAFVADEALGLWTCTGQPGLAEAADRPVSGRFEHRGQVVAVLDPSSLVRCLAGENHVGGVVT